MLRVKKGFTLIELLIVIAIILILIAIALPNFLEAQIRARVTKASGELRSLATALFDYNTALISSAKEGIFPPAGGVSQNSAIWSPWRDDVTFGAPNSPDNNMHACSIIWVEGSFYSQAGDNSPSSANSGAPVPGNSEHYDLRVMTSPIEAITQVPFDPFKNSGSFNSQYDYFGLNLRDTFVMRSLGPDGAAAVGCSAAGFNCACVRGQDCLAGDGGGKGSGLSQDPNATIGAELDPENVGFSNITQALRAGPAVYAPTNGTKSLGDIWRIMQ
jgi:prepilin-type N-terminal cleavage/methylation domain-containing protein